MVHGRPGGI